MFILKRTVQRASQIHKENHTKHIKFKKIDIQIFPICEADNNGKILKKHWSYTVWIDSVHYTPGVSMLIYTIKSFYRAKKWKQGPDLKIYFEPMGRKDEWWRVSRMWYCRLVHRKLYRSIFQPAKIDIKSIIRKYS